MKNSKLTKTKLINFIKKQPKLINLVMETGTVSDDFINENTTFRIVFKLNTKKVKW